MALCRTSLYPIPVYCEGTLQPLQQLPCQKAPFYTIFHRSLSTTGGDENRPPPALVEKTRNRAPPECLPLSGYQGRNPSTQASHPQVLDETIAVPGRLSSARIALIHLYFAFWPEVRPRPVCQYMLTCLGETGTESLVSDVGRWELHHGFKSTHIGDTAGQREVSKHGFIVRGITEEDHLVR